MLFYPPKLSSCKQGPKRLVWVLIMGLTAIMPGRPLAQRQVLTKLDSLTALLPKTTSDTAKVLLLSDIAVNYFVVDPLKGISYGNQAAVLAEKAGWKKGMAAAYNALGANYWATNKLAQAQDYYLKALKINKALGNKSQQARNLHNLGTTYNKQYDFDKALLYFGEALKIDEEIGDLLKAEGCLENMAIIYFGITNYAKALEYYQLALNINKQLGLQRNVAYVIVKMGDIYTRAGSYDTALQYELQGLKTFEQLGDKDDLADTYDVLGDTYKAKKQYNLAILYYQKAIEMYKGLNTSIAILSTGIHLGKTGQVYLEMAEEKKGQVLEEDALHETKSVLLNKASGYLTKATGLLLSQHSWMWLTSFYRALSNIHAQQGNYKQALDDYKLYSSYNDSTINIEKDKEITRHQVEYEFALQQDSANYLNQIQKDQLNVLGKEKKLSQLTIKQQWLYLIIAFVFMVLIVCLITFRINAKSVHLKNELAKEKAEKQLKDAEYKQKVNEVTFSALRSQMNPHFIFNCLNSIKLYTEQHDTEAASLYLTKFSQLIRGMLDSSQAENIDLAKEIKLLNLYIELEGMRVKQKLKYNIQVDGNIDISFIEIPPLLIQPFVENAIWHGLMPKEEGGTIDIHFSLSNNKQHLVVTVKDDGVGRARAAEFKSKAAVIHKSHGTKITEDRIRLLNEKYKSNAEIYITDLTDTDNIPAGTLVTIKIPLL